MRSSRSPTRRSSLVLIENPGHGGTLNHLGVEVGSTGAVSAGQQCLTSAGLATTSERETTCRYATQDKFWVAESPGGERWEFYAVLADSPTFAGTQDPAACRGTQGTAEAGPAAAGARCYPGRGPSRAAARATARYARC